jgi:hypothetical protein
MEKEGINKETKGQRGKVRVAASACSHFPRDSLCLIALPPFYHRQVRTKVFELIESEKGS